MATRCSIYRLRIALRVFSSFFQKAIKRLYLKSGCYSGTSRKAWSVPSAFNPFCNARAGRPYLVVLSGSTHLPHMTGLSFHCPYHRKHMSFLSHSHFTAGLFHSSNLLQTLVSAQKIRLVYSHLAPFPFLDWGLFQHGKPAGFVGAFSWGVLGTESLLVFCLSRLQVLRLRLASLIE